MRAALYARVSTTKGRGQSPDMQLRELRMFCEHRGWTLAGEYVDVGVSGAKERRPQLDRLMAACQRRQVDAVVDYPTASRAASGTWLRPLTARHSAERP
jgi:DNA invertase Pin-like site-specific DNA recombinase